MANKATAAKFVRILRRAKLHVDPRSKKLIKGIDYLIAAVTPRFEPIMKHVAPEELDRRGSLIGGCPFTSRNYPTPRNEYKFRGVNEPMAPLVQLNLDDIWRATGKTFGSGLLQLWLPGKSYGENLSTPCRVVPRLSAVRTKRLVPCAKRLNPYYLEEMGGASDRSELDILRAVDPEAAQQQENEMEYFDALGGFDWGGSRLGLRRRDSLTAKGRAPQQIVGWKSMGWVLPHDCDVEEVLESVDSDTEWEAAVELARADEKCNYGLCEVNADSSQNSLNDKYSLWNGWLPLFSFQGPFANGSCSDNQTIVYRKKGKKFEYGAVFSRRYCG